MADIYYVGLAATMHDPAIALVDQSGAVLFAEALERPLQDKRAWGQAPDHIAFSEQLLRRYCEPGSEIVIGVSWSRGLRDRLRLTALARLTGLRGTFGRVLESSFARRDHLVWPTTRYASLIELLGVSLEQASANLGFLGYRHYPPRYFDHHLTHAAFACVASPFDTALVAVVDGFGERASTGFYRFDDGTLTSLSRPNAWYEPPASLGMFYAMICELCGFSPVAGEEWKVMGLAPLAQPDDELYDCLSPLLRVDGITLRQGVPSPEYRRRTRRARTIAERLATPSGRDASASQGAGRASIAATGQRIFVERMTELLNELHSRHGEGTDALVLTGGCALNSACNGGLLETTAFQRLSVPCAPADDGNAVGAAHLARLADMSGSRLTAGSSTSPYLGSEASPRDLDRLTRYGSTAFDISRGPTPRDVAALLADGRVVGWMHGRAEFGPRALGNRSILADPRNPRMRDRINAEVKFREPFRPFAPAILHEYGDVYFENYAYSPYMERALRFRPQVRDIVPAVVHADGTGRLQSVTETTAPALHALLSAFNRMTGVPVLLNTSLNRMGKPIAHSVDDAVALFLGSALDVLIIDDVMLQKKSCST
ncbi:MAG: carbamoyltransferase C-terminal domain-containing protein [Pseudomonadales bacterium]